MKIRPVGAEMSHEDAANSRFSQVREGAWKIIQILL